MSRLVVRVATADREVVVKARNLNLTWTDRGGPESCTFDLPESITDPDPVLAPLSRVSVDDPRTGERLWQGYVDETGKGVDESGHSWRVTAVGASSVLGDRDRPYIVVDRNLGGWRHATESASNVVSGRASVTSLPGDDDTEAILLQIPPGVPIEGGSVVIMQYDVIKDAGQVLGGFGFTVVSGFNSANYALESRVGPTATSVHSDAYTTTPTTHSGRWDNHWSGDKTWLAYRIRRSGGGATNVANDANYGGFYDVHVAAKLTAQDGTGYVNNTVYADGLVLAHEVIVDALQRFTSLVDVANADIDDSFTYTIDQLAYPDGTRLPDVLDDLALFEPDLAYEVGPVGASGLHSFRVWQYGTEARYEASTVDGWNSPGGEQRLANSVTVYWTDNRGREQASTYTAEVAALDQFGRTRDAESVDLGTEVGSQAAADRVGAALAEQIAQVPDAGTLTVARPIYDGDTARWVMPWQVRPGFPVNVRDLGIDALRCTEVAYDDEAGTSTLTLGTPVLSTEELVARLAKRRKRRR